MQAVISACLPIKVPVRQTQHPCDKELELRQISTTLYSSFTMHEMIAKHAAHPYPAAHTRSVQCIDKKTFNQSNHGERHAN